MKTRFIIYLISISVLLNISACSYIKSWFPDKTRDYLDTASIPPLKIPVDLGGDFHTGSTTTDSTLPAADNAAVKNSQAVAENEAATPSTTEQASIDPKLISVELVKNKDGMDSLLIGAPLATAWQLVNKGLGHQSIEVTGRNQAEGEFTIQYELDEKKAQDGSMWDEVVFLFKGVQGNEKEYRLKLVEVNQQTNVLVQDKDKHPASNEVSLKLLTNLQKIIKASQAV